MKLNYQARVAYARTIASSSNLSLIESEKVTTPCTDGVRLWVPPYNPEWDEHEWDEINWWGKLIHETYHNDRNHGHQLHFALLKARAEKLKAEGKQFTQRWKTASNVFEDHRIEHNEYGQYPGQDHCMDALRYGMMLELRNDVMKPGLSGPDAALYVLQYAAFAVWQFGCSGEPVEHWDMGPEVKEAWDKCKHLLPDVLAMRDGNDSLILADKFCELFAEDGDEDKGKAEPATSNEEGDGKEGEGEGDGEEGDGGEKEGKSAPRYAVMGHEPPTTDTLPRENNTEWRYRPSPAKGEYPGGIPFEVIHSGKLVGAAGTFVSRVMGHVHMQGLASQIKKLLMVLSATRMQGGHKRGHLDSSSLWKGVVYRNTETGRRVFKQKDDTLSLDTVVSLVVDQSGSMMSLEKIHCAAASAVLMNEVFGKVGIKCRVVGFSDTRNETVHYIHQDFGEKVRAEQLAERIGKSIQHKMSANADGENIAYEYTAMLDRPEKKKVMIVLSDGMPADSKLKYDVTSYTERVIKKIEKDKRVNIVGIGIMSDSVSTFYRKYAVINAAEEVEAAVLKVLKKEVVC